MATLTEVSAVARKAIKFGIVFVIFLMFLPLISSVVKKMWEKSHPLPPPPPNMSLGKTLPNLIFPNLGMTATPEIKLETISGGLPNLGTTAKVYLVGVNKSRLLTLDRYRLKATAIGLTKDPVQVDDRKYKFLHPTMPAFMEVDLITDQIEYKYDWTRDKDLGKTGLLGPSNTMISEAKEFFSRLGVLPEDVAKGTAKVNYYIASGSAYVPTSNYNDASFARVDLFRANLDEMKIVTTGGDSSPVNVTFVGVKNLNSLVVAANFQYSRLVGKDIFGTYPLKGSAAAFQELVSGKGHYVKKVLPVATVRKISLAYYESSVSQDYLQPVYVFEGDGGFLAYVPAISPGIPISESNSK